MAHVLFLFLVILGTAFRLVPHAPGLVPLGAIALFSGSRLPRRSAAAVPVLILVISDLFLGWDAPHVAVRMAVYGTLAAAALAGSTLARRRAPWRIAGLTAGTSIVFYLTTNFAMWAAESYYAKTAEGLALCYAAGLPALLRSLAADLAGAALLFGADAFVRRTAARRAVVASATIAAAALLAAPPARAQTPGPVTENVIVSASIAPEDESSPSASVTVISRERIDKSGKTDVLELLREVPGVDVVQSGGAGTAASVFIRGGTSSQTLVLIDGVRVNDPYGAGYDFSALSTQNVDRIEVVRGPFSALYGADAVGGVVSILTRGASSEPSGRFTAAAGNRAFHEETLFATGGSGPFALALSGRDVHDGGDPQDVAGTTVDHSAWNNQTGSAQFAWTPSEAFRTGLNVERTFARTQIPSDGAAPTLNRTTEFAQTTWTLPVRAHLSDANALTGSLSQVDFRPTSDDPDDPTGFVTSDTIARTRGARAADTWTISAENSLSAAGSYEHSTVESRGAFGPIIEDRRTSIWGIALEDQWTLAGGRLRALGGIRYDRNSQFGSATDPRISLVWNAGVNDALRVSYGTGFRAPSIVDLYYPFYGNPDLKPERSRSYEAGFSHTLDPIRLDLAIFRTDFRDLIQFDNVSQLPGNVGRARTDGVEASASYSAHSFSGRIAYTYLHAVDEMTGDPLVRRPRHRGSLDLAWNGRPWLVSTTLIAVGRRADFQAAFPYGATEDPPYLRVDAHAEYRWRSLAPFVTVENALDRKYEEANGFPATRRRVLGGIIASF